MCTEGNTLHIVKWRPLLSTLVDVETTTNSAASKAYAWQTMSTNLIKNREDNFKSHRRQFGDFRSISGKMI